MTSDDQNQPKTARAVIIAACLLLVGGIVLAPTATALPDAGADNDEVRLNLDIECTLVIDLSSGAGSGCKW